jgi:hypothetical protein
MQFPVPQFTDVEDTIIGSLTVKQFLILLGTMGVVFFFYSITKDLYVTAAAGVLIGIPGIVITFGQFNGRPMYFSATVFLNFWTRPKFFIFRKQAITDGVMDVKNLEQSNEPVSVEPGDNPRNRLRKIQYQLEQRAKQEDEILSDLHRVGSIPVTPLVAPASSKNRPV